MPDIVNADLRDTAAFAAGAQMVFQEIDGSWDDPLIFLNVLCADIVHDFAVEKLRQRYVPDTVFRLWRGDNVAVVVADIGFRDLEQMLFLIDVRRSQCEQLADADAAPVEQFKGEKYAWLSGKFPNKCPVLFERPEPHCARRARTHVVRLVVRIFEIIVFCGIFKHREQMHVDGF